MENRTEVRIDGFERAGALAFLDWYRTEGNVAFREWVKKTADYEVRSNIDKLKELENERQALQASIKLRTEELDKEIQDQHEHINSRRKAALEAYGVTDTTIGATAFAGSVVQAFTTAVQKDIKPFKHTPEEARKLWIEALRSGEYRQARSTLCKVPAPPSTDPVSYCCLGVACEVFRKMEPEQGARWLDNQFVDQSGGVSGSRMTRVVSKWLDMRDNPNVKTTEWGGTDLISLNDGRNYNFNQIADVIESNYCTKPEPAIITVEGIQPDAGAGPTEVGGSPAVG